MKSLLKFGYQANFREFLKTQARFKVEVLAHAFISSVWKEEADQHEFEASLIYIINSQ